MILSAHQPQYLPWLGFFDKIARSDVFVFLDCVQYKKREYQNRNSIKSSQGKVLLTVPVLSKGRQEQMINEVVIDNSVAWQKQHWRTLCLNLSKAPYWSYYQDELQTFYQQPYTYLCDFTLEMTRWFLKALGISTTVYRESELETSSWSTQRLIELCQKTGATTYYSGEGGKAYLDEQEFAQHRLALQYQHYQHPRYLQQFGDFLSHLSALDLLMNVGPQSLPVLCGDVR